MVPGDLSTFCLCTLQQKSLGARTWHSEEPLPSILKGQVSIPSTKKEKQVLGASEMAQQGKALAGEPDSPIPQPTQGKERGMSCGCPACTAVMSMDTEMEK